MISSTEPLVDRLLFEAVEPRCADGTPAASFVQATWPLSTDELLAQSVADINGYSAFRAAKFYEALDALTGDVAYRHTDGQARGLFLVTASHFHAIKFMRTLADRDLTLRCYITGAGSSSLEVRTDAVQVDGKGREWLISACHTTMVALDRATMRPVKDCVPPLVLPAGGEERAAALERLELAALHKRLQAERKARAMSLHGGLASQPPTPEEMRQVHELHRAAVAMRQAASPRERLPDEVSEHTHTVSTVVFPEQRNVQGTLFGGFVIGGAFDLAHFAATFYTRGAPFQAVSLDDALFLQPVAIGDMVRFVARVVHSGEDGIFRVHVAMSVLEPNDPTRLPQLTNEITFAFATSLAARRAVLPASYTEVLLHVEAARRHAVQGLGKHAWGSLEAFFREVEEGAKRT